VEDEANPILSPTKVDPCAPQEMLIRRLSASSSCSASSSRSRGSSFSGSPKSSILLSTSASAATSYFNVITEDDVGEDYIDDRVKRLYRLVKKPWEIDGDHLRKIKELRDAADDGDAAKAAASPTWSVGQLLRAALYVAHSVQMEEIVQMLEEGGDEDEGKGQEEAAAKLPRLKSTTNRAASSATVLRDFTWNEQGFPLVETLGMEKAASKIDEKVETVRQLVEERGTDASKQWTETLKQMGVVEEEEGEEEEEEEEAKRREVATSSSSTGDELIMRLITLEARNHAIVLRLLSAIAKLIC